MRPPHPASSRPIANLTHPFLVVTNTFAAVTLGLAVHLLFQNLLFPIKTAPSLVAAFIHLVSITVMRVPFFARLSETYSVLRALTSRVSIEIVWLSLLCVMWLAVNMVIRTVFLCTSPRMCPAHAGGLGSNSLL